MVSFEIFVKAMPPSLSELKVLPSFCFAFKIPDDVAASNTYLVKEFGGGIQRVAIWIYYKFAFLRTQNCISCSTSKYLFVHFLYYINFCNIKEEE